MPRDDTPTKAGYYSLELARLYKLDTPQYVDIKHLIYSWTITESMDMGYMAGSANIVDGTGLIYNFLKVGLRGEEEFEVSYYDYFEKRRTNRFVVYAITGVKPIQSNNETALEYTIHYVSKEKFYTDRFDIQRSYRGGVISDYVSRMWKQYWVGAEPGALSTYNRPLTEDDLTVYPTAGKQDIIIPKYKPEQAMHLMSRKAADVTPSKMQVIRFYQNRDQFRFGSHDLLIDAGIDNPLKHKFIVVNLPDYTPSGQDYIMQNIISIEFPDHVNTMKDMNDGAYYRRTTELDFMNRAIGVVPFKYLDKYVSYNLPDATVSPRGGEVIAGNRSKHTKAFVDKHLSDYKDTLVIRDYAYSDYGFDPYLTQDRHYNRIYNDKVANLYHHENEMTDMTVYGRNDLLAGDIVEIEVLRAIGDREETGPVVDEERSGFYLIEKVDNIFKEDTYTQNIMMSKSSFRGKPESADYSFNGKNMSVSEFLETNRGTFEDPRIPKAT